MNKSTNKTFLIVVLSFLAAILMASSDGKEETSADHGTPEIKIIDDAPSAAFQKELMATVSRFWKANFEESFSTTYEMHIASYKEAVPLDKFLQKKRSKLDKYTFRSITFMGEMCARVRLKIKLKTEIGILDRIPSSQVWIWDATTSKWEVYDDPYKSSVMGKARKLASPCVWPARRPHKKANASKM